MSIIHYEACPVCKQSNFKFVFDVVDYTVSKQKFSIYECEHCSLRFTQDVPTEDAIGIYYKSEDYISHTNTSKGLINNLYQKVRTITMKQKAALVMDKTRLQKGSLLDIGSGAGAFLSTMQGRGWTVLGLEPDADARKVALADFNISSIPSSEIYHLETEKFDAITMWHVLEHVHQLHDYISTLHKILKPGGKLLIAVPNYTSKDAATYQQYWAAYDVPRHLYHFSPKALRKLMEPHGFKVAEMKPMWYDSFYISMLSSKYKTGAVKYFAAGLHGLSSNLKAFNNTESCSSIIYVIEKI